MMLIYALQQIFLLRFSFFAVFVFCLLFIMLCINLYAVISCHLVNFPTKGQRRLFLFYSTLILIVLPLILKLFVYFYQLSSHL